MIGGVDLIRQIIETRTFVAEPVAHCATTKLLLLLYLSSHTKITTRYQETACLAKSQHALKYASDGEWLTLNDEATCVF